jgi:hypothetical protein
MDLVLLYSIIVAIWDSKAAQTPFFNNSTFFKWNVQFFSFTKVLCHKSSFFMPKNIQFFFAWLFSFIWPDLIHLATKYRRPYREIAPIGLPTNISFLIEGCELVIGGYQYDMRQDLTLKGASTFVNNTRNNLAIYSLCSHITSLFHT